MPLGDNLESTDDETRTGAVTRRLFLRRTMVLGVSAPALLAILQACGGEDEEEAVEEEGEGETTDAATDDGESTDAGTEAGEDTDAAGASSPAASPAGSSASPMASPGAGTATPMGSPSASPVGGADDEATPTT